MNNWIENKVAIVTGGGSGIGQAIAMSAGRDGALVVIADIDKEGGCQTAEEIKKLGGTARFVSTDVTNSAQIDTMVEAARKMGPIHYLANSAGLQTYGTVDSTDEELWDRTMDVNFKSMFLVIKAVLPDIRANGGGGIVNISSVQGLRCQRNVLAYASSKGAVIAMTRSMALDHASEGVSINCICPGSVDTPMLRFGAGQHGHVEQVIEEWGNHHPIGRIGTPEEIARTALFLWGPDSNFIVGQAIVADGGLGSVIL